MYQFDDKERGKGIKDGRYDLNYEEIFYQDNSLLPSVCRCMIFSNIRTMPVRSVKSDSMCRFFSVVSSKNRWSFDPMSSSGFQ